MLPQRAHLELLRELALGRRHLSEGRLRAGRAKQTEFVTITNCYVSGCWEEGTLLDGTYKKFGPDVRVPHTGRIKFGTESNGGFRNITISNCVFEGCQGLALETVDGALLEDVTITNISMRDIISAPIFLRLGSVCGVRKGRRWER